MPRCNLCFCCSPLGWSLSLVSFEGCHPGSPNCLSAEHKMIGLRSPLPMVSVMCHGPEQATVTAPSLSREP